MKEVQIPLWSIVTVKETPNTMDGRVVQIPLWSIVTNILIVSYFLYTEFKFLYGR